METGRISQFKKTKVFHCKENTDFVGVELGWNSR